MNRLFVLLLVFSTVGVAAEKEKATFTATKNNPYYTSFKLTTPGAAGTSTTNCSGSASTYGNTTTGSADCNSTYTSPTPATTNTYYQFNVVVEGVLSRADGRKYQVAIWCRKSFRNCANIYENDPHEAELEGDSLWIHGKNPFAKKQATVKYKIIRAVEIKESEQPVQKSN